MNSRREGFFRVIAQMMGLRSFRLTTMLAAILLTGNTLVTAFPPVFAVDLFRANTTDVGLALAVFNAVCVSTTLLLGRASDRFGRRRTVIAGMGICLLSALSYTLASSFPQMLLVTVGMAIGFSLAGPSLLAFLANETDPEMYGTAMGVYGMFEDAGVMASPLIYGLAWSRMGAVSIFYVSAIVWAVGIVVTLLLGDVRRRVK